MQSDILLFSPLQIAYKLFLLYNDYQLFLRSLITIIINNKSNIYMLCMLDT